MRSGDRFRIDEWDALPELCFIAGCDNDDIDHRGPIFLRDGSIHKACVEHWEPIVRVLGEQVAWQGEAANWTAKGDVS